MKNSQPIAILMATYNGEAYLRAQLDSLLRQTYIDWFLYVHDDGSTDQTCTILREYAEANSGKIKLLDYPAKGGACRNFMSILEQVDSDYYMFCDQDDVWLPNKIEVEMKAMKEAENRHPSQAIVIATDLNVVDAELKMQHESLWQEAGIYPQYIRTFDEMAANTLVTGCTMLFNQQAKELIRPISRHTVMHDGWVALCVRKGGGLVECLPIRTVLYRQHGRNTLGAQDVSHLTIADRIQRLPVSWRVNRGIYRMLCDLEYGSVLKYAYYKYLYHRRIRSEQY